MKTEWQELKIKIIKGLEEKVSYAEKMDLLDGIDILIPYLPVELRSYVAMFLLRALEEIEKEYLK